MPSYTATGLVLHRLNTGETDKILTLYTREHGKLSVIAKGARKAGSRLSGATELFTETRFLLASGRSLEIVQQAEIQQSFPGIRTDLDKLARATYLCELLDRLTAESDALQSPELYDLLLSALYLLQRATTYPDAVVHAYELHLLAAIGYAPALENCVRCGEPLTGRQVGFSPALGGALCPADRYRADDAQALSFDGLKLLRLLTETEPEQLLTLQPSPKVAAEVVRAMRWYIRYRADRDLESLDFLDSLRMTG
ncbi:MAG: replication and repair protein RecO [Chthonomonadaceae bacterium]|nr:replication and repair protein RecO [Chthonomonadaceae bacterium]